MRPAEHAGCDRSAPRARSSLSPLQVLALGVLQGPTELLPISSSAHTRLVPWLAGWSYIELDPALRKSLEAALHLGAAVALALDMRAELAEAARTLTARRAAAIALSLAPPIFAGYTLERPIERRLGGPRSIAAGLIAGAAAMAIADTRHARRGPDVRSNSRTPHALDATRGPSEHETSRAPGGWRREQDAGPIDGLALGLAQAAALMPGVSRNGATLTAARARGFAREDAHALSWHAALPVMFGAGVLKGWRLLGKGRRAESGSEEQSTLVCASGGAWLSLAIGAGSAYASTRVSARLLRRPRVSRRSLLPWAAYRCALAAVAIERDRDERGKGTQAERRI